MVDSHAPEPIDDDMPAGDEAPDVDAVEAPAEMQAGGEAPGAEDPKADSYDPFDLSPDAVNAAFAGIAAELGPSGLTPDAIVPGPEGGTTQAGPRDYAVADVEEGYIPPDTEPLDTSDTFLVGGWVALGGGLGALLLMVLLWPGVPRPVLAIAALVAIGGAAILTWRMPRHGRHDDHDNGAVV